MAGHRNQDKTEFERRFLVRPGWQPPDGDTGHRMVQGYLSTDPRRIVRVRDEKDGCVLAIKGKKSGTRAKEFQYPIPEEDYDYFIREMADVVEKTRYEITYAGKTWEVDVFHGLNDGLIIAEVELRGESEEIDLPGWVDEDNEVTEKFRYSNSNLATKPWTTWSRM